MPTDYANSFFGPIGPMTLVFGNEKYYVKRIERSFEHSTLGESRVVLDIQAWKPTSELTSMLLTPDYSIKKILCNGPVTIVFWADETKTVVKLAEGDRHDRKIALLYAFAKKKFGNNSRIHKEIDKFAKSNAQRIALLKYIIAKDGIDIDEIMDNLEMDYTVPVKVS